MTQAASGSYPLLDVMWTMFVFFGLVVFFWLLFTVFGDLFRRHDIGGGAKTLWTIFVIFLPYIGTFTYLIVEGRNMADRRARDLAVAREQTDDYIRSVAANGSSGVGEVERGKQLLDSGAITEDEFDALKRRALV